MKEGVSRPSEHKLLPEFPFSPPIKGTLNQGNIYKQRISGQVENLQLNQLLFNLDVTKSEAEFSAQ